MTRSALVGPAEATRFESFPDGVFVTDLEGITYANRAGLRFLGVPSLDDLDGPDDIRTRLALRALDGTPLEEGADPISRALLEGPVVNELLLRDPASGHDLILRVSASPLLEAGEVKGAIAIVADVTSSRPLPGASRTEMVTKALVRRVLAQLGTKATTAQLRRQLGHALARDARSDELSAYLAAFSEMGLGSLELHQINGDRFTFRGRDLFDREAHSRSPTCALGLGFTEGIVTSLTAEPSLGSELECQSMGRPHCVFVVRARWTKGH